MCSHYDESLHACSVAITQATQPHPQTNRCVHNNTTGYTTKVSFLSCRTCPWLRPTPSGNCDVCGNRSVQWPSLFEPNIIGDFVTRQWVLAWAKRCASRISLQNAPILRLLLKVAAKGTHQCDFNHFGGTFGFQRFLNVLNSDLQSRAPQTWKARPNKLQQLH